MYWRPVLNAWSTGWWTCRFSLRLADQPLATGEQAQLVGFPQQVLRAGRHGAQVARVDFGQHQFDGGGLVAGQAGPARLAGERVSGKPTLSQDQHMAFSFLTGTAGPWGGGLGCYGGFVAFIGVA